MADTREPSPLTRTGSTLEIVRRAARFLVPRPPAPGRLATFPDVARVVTVEESSWTAERLDTTDLRLLRDGVLLDRRCGGSAPGWHLELPVENGRYALVSSSGVDAAEAVSAHDLPEEMLDLTRSRTLGADVAPVARLRTARRRYHLLGPEGRLLVEVLIDWLSAWPPSPTDPSATDPSHTDPDPSSTGPSSTGPSSTGPSSTDPSSTHPSHTDPSSTHPSHTDPSSTHPSHTDPVETSSLKSPAARPSHPTGKAAPAVTGPRGRRSNARQTSWHEVEIRHVDDAQLAATVVAALADHERPASPPLSRELVRGSAGDAVPPRGTAGGEVLAYASCQIAVLVRQAPLVRLDVEGSVHRARVATRRLRSLLTTFGALFDRRFTDPLRDELRWLAGELADARDTEIQRDRLIRLVTTVSAQLVPAAVTRAAIDHIDTELRSRRRTGVQRAVVALEGDRFVVLLDTLDRLLASPPLAGRASRGAGELRRPVARSVRRLDARAATALAATDPRDRQRAEHEVRKAAERVCYAAEAVAPAVGRPARRLAARAAMVQETLGDRQDAAVTAQLLRELALIGDTSSAAAFTFGVLAGQAHEQADQPSDGRELRRLRAAAARWPG